MDSELEFLHRLHVEQSDREWRLTVVIEEFHRKRREETRAIEEWALRRAIPNPKFDEEWSI